MAAAKLTGTWTLSGSENFDAYLIHLGVSKDIAEKAKASKPTISISVDGSKWKISTTSVGVGTQDLEFTIGQEFKTKTIDGREVISIFTIDGEKLVQKETAVDPNQKNSQLIRFVNANGDLVAEISSDGVQATRTYAKA